LNYGFFLGRIKISPTRFSAATLLLSGTLSVWFLFTNSFNKVFEELLRNQLLLNIGAATFFGTGAFSAIIGSKISEKVDRRKLLFFWIIAGIGSISLLAVVNGVVLSLFSCILLGFSIGFGLPSCMALFAEYTVVEERAKVAGAIIFETFIMLALAVTLTSFLNLGAKGTILFALVFRSISIIPLAIDSCKRENIKARPWGSVFSSRNFVLYLVPWTIFNIIGELDHYVWPKLLVNSVNLAAFDTGIMIQNAGVAVFALVAGFAADRLGRRTPFITSLAVLGISFVLLGLYPLPETIITYLSVSGLAWSFLMVIYLCIVGDLSPAGSREKFYAVGFAIPLIVYMFVRGVIPSIMPSIMTYGAPPQILSPILSIILFLSIIPVLQAKETLSEQKKNERKIKEHIDRIGKVIQESNKDTGSN
jgi:MFS family permease